ncbi:MAG: hypothetical protein RL023_886 [Candidatus Parcubacteria bacterium]
MSFFYGDLLSTEKRHVIIESHYDSLVSLKESLYSLDFWLWQSMSQYIQSLPETKTIRNDMMQALSHAIIRNSIL